MPRTIVLAYSGGLDTSIIVPWLKENYDARVICVAADIGQGADELARRAREGDRLGRRRVLRRRSARGVRRATSSSRRSRAGAIYNRKYLLGTSMARPLIAQASGRGRAPRRRRCARARLHRQGQRSGSLRADLRGASRRTCRSSRRGASGTSAAARTRSPTRPRTASRSPRRKEKIYSRDAQPLAPLARGRHPRGSERRAAGRSCSCSPRDPTHAPDDAGRRRHRLRAGHAGVGQRRDARRRSRSSPTLNAIGGKHGVGRVDLVEDRLVGMKSRGVYETPGGTLLYTAHSELEQLVLDRRTLAAKDLIAPRYADLVYEGRWWTTEREAYDAFVNVTQERVTGTVTLRLYKGCDRRRRPRERARAVRRALRHLRRGRRLPAERRRRLHPPLRAAGARARPQGSGAARPRRLASVPRSGRSAVGSPELTLADRMTRRIAAPRPAAKSHKLWGGRFGAGPTPAFDALNNSIGIDFRLWPFDIRLSKAWAVALWGAGVLTLDESKAHRARARRRRRAARRAASSRSPSDEDVHTLIDRLLHEEIGDVASKLHTGRSRNDQVATATRLWSMDAVQRARQRRARASAGDARPGARALETALMPSYTHMQRAIPVSAAHWMLSHFWPLERDRARLARRAALGRGAAARLRRRRWLRLSHLARAASGKPRLRRHLAELHRRRQRSRLRRRGAVHRRR